MEKQSFIRRFYIYQKERFPFLAHGILISIFTFSAISYSRICRGAENFIDLDIYLLTAFSTVTLFFLLRLSDEFKDREYDAQHRPHLAVPRGVISFSELRIIGAVTFAIQLIVNILYLPQMLGLYAGVIVFLILMFKEFFVGEWLNKHIILYVVSHMFIIPLIDIFASGADWLLAGADAPMGLLFFFVVSFMNGIVLEFGRKIKATENEEHNTYTTRYGVQKATWIFIISLFITLIFSILAAWFAGYGITGALVLVVVFVVCAIPAFMFLKNQTVKISKTIELASGLWTAAMYLTLGGLPMIYTLIFK